MNEKLYYLKKNIDDLRTTLNEMSVSLLTNNNSFKIIKISRKLDLLIVEYTLLNNETDKNPQLQKQK